MSYELRVFFASQIAELTYLGVHGEHLGISAAARLHQLLA